MRLKAKRTLLVYASYLVFQLWSHASLYDDKHEDNFKSTPHTANVTQAGSHIRQRLHIKSHASKDAAQLANAKASERSEKPPISEVNGSAHSTTIESSDGHANGHANDENAYLNGGSTGIDVNPTIARADAAAAAEKGKAEEEDGAETPSMSLVMCVSLLVVVTVVSFSLRFPFSFSGSPPSQLCAVTADFLVDSLNGVTDGSNGLTKEWVGLILLPIVGNAAEHVTAVTVSVKDKLNLSIGVAVGSSIVRFLLTSVISMELIGDFL